MTQIRENQNKTQFEVGKKCNIFFTSDTHFSHTNIMKYCNRPFSTIEEMNETLINNWNSVVGENDIVFHLGDFAFCGSQEFNNILDSLNGKIYLIIGNHDWKSLKQGYMSKFAGVEQQMYISVHDTVDNITSKIYLNHFPMLCFAGSWKGVDATWQLFGHVHSNPNIKTGLDHSRLNNLMPTQYDVGVDNNNFTPISFREVKQIITDQLMSLNMYRK